MKIYGRLLYLLVRLWSASMRYRLEDQGGITTAPPEENALFAIWHNRLGLMPYIYKRYLGSRRLAVMVSGSRDGSYLADIIRGFGFTPVIGSSSYRGREALQEITQLVREGYNAGWGIDGPRGPRGVAKMGMIKLASLTGRPIIPTTFTAEPHKRLEKSWDRFIVPIPLGLCRVRFGMPLSVPPDADPAVFEEHRLALEAALTELSGGEV